MKKLTIFLSILAICNSLIAQIPNSGFETWTTVGSYDTPTGWDNLNATTSPLSVYTCEKGTPGDPGASYLKLTSKTVTGIGVAPGVAVSGVLDPLTFLPKSGFPYTTRPGYLTGNWQYMEFSGTGADAGHIIIFLSKWNIPANRRDTIAFKNYTLPGMIMSWASFSIPLTYYSTATPDSAIIVLSSSGTAPVNNSYLYVDNLAFTGTPVTSVTNIPGNTPLSYIYPNPAASLANISYNGFSEKNIQINIADINGRNIISFSPKAAIGENKFQVNVSDLVKGVYIVRINDGQNIQIQKLIVE
jgi:hypothetical protein